RYYYNKRILHKTKGKRFTYKFNFNKLVMPNYPFINIRPNGVVPQSAPPVPTASSRFHFPPLDPHSPGEDSQPGARFPAPSLLQPAPEPLGDSERKAEPGDLEETPSDWRRDLLAPAHPPAASAAAAGGGGGGGAPKRKPDVVLPLFSRPGIFPEHPHSPFAVSPLPGRPGVLNVPLSPALSLTPTLFSYSPSPGLSPFATSSCFSFNPEEMKHYLHSQACSVFNYHLSPRTFPRYPLVVPPLQCQVPLDDAQPQFPIKLQPPPAGRKHRERMESPEGGGGGGGGGAGGGGAAGALNPPRVKVEPAAEKDEEEKAEKRPEDEEDGEEEEEEEEEEEKSAVFARPAAPPAWMPVPAAHPAAGAEESAEKGAQEGPGDGGPREDRREDALMPPKLRLKRRWNGDSRHDGQQEARQSRGTWH
ncbi:ETV3 protein, partial [Sylvia borin]|nr:ETV3 protein [Sylvia borin]